jgi:lipopolysaccharide export system protein LptA
MILNHMDASIQKCRVLKRSCTPASQGSHQKPIKKNSEQQRLKNFPGHSVYTGSVVGGETIFNYFFSQLQNTSIQNRVQ